MGRPRDFMRMLVPSATVFFSSGCIMILELVASRLVARDLGSSLYTWTAIIGVVLAGISVGNYLGGRIADRHHARRALAVLFGLASGACVGIILVNNVVGDWMWLWQLSWPAHVFIHVAIVFLVPSTLLGMISPVVAKMALDKGLPPGRTIGDIYAWGAAGSIAGTFFAGFYLIATFGSITIIWAIGAAMLAIAILYWISCWAMYLWAMFFGALATMGMAPVDWALEAGSAVGLREPADPTVLYEAETPYCHVKVRQVTERPDRRAFWQDQLMHSEIVIDDVTNLQYFYTEIYAAVTHHLAERTNAPSMMVIGGGGYAFPQYLKAKWPAGQVDVVEIDPGVTEAARQAFGLDESDGIRTIQMDARNYVEQLLESGADGTPEGYYDLIFEDAINDYSVPFQLVTQEFTEKVRRLLADDGVYMVNLIDTYDNARFLGAVYNTLREVFDHVYVVTSPGDLPSLRNTFVVVASPQSLDLPAILNAYNPHLRFWVLDESQIAEIQDKSDGLILTDDFAPVENLLAPVVRQGAREMLARKYLDQAQELQRQQEYERSIARYRQAVALNPSMSIKAYNEIAMMRFEQEDLEGAEEAFRKAIAYHAAVGTQEPVIASVHHSLGVLLQQKGEAREAREHLRAAVRWARIELEANPRSVVVWDQLGETLATMGDFKGASDAFEKAVTLEPGNSSHYEKLVRTLELQERFGEAIEVARRHMRIEQERGNRELAGQLRQYIELLEYQRAKQER